MKFADNTTVAGLITDNDETAYREEVRDLAVWCQDSNFSHNVGKTKELIVDYRKRRAGSSSVSTSLRTYHGPNRPNSSEEGTTMPLPEEGTTMPLPLRKLKRCGMGIRSSKGSTAAPLRASWLAAWYGNCSASDRKTL
jgi:hypothetical protein